jgi:hypothetical protein
MLCAVRDSIERAGRIYWKCTAVLARMSLTFRAQETTRKLWRGCVGDIMPVSVVKWPLPFSVGMGNLTWQSWIKLCAKSACIRRELPRKLSWATQPHLQFPESRCTAWLHDSGCRDFLILLVRSTTWGSGNGVLETWTMDSKENP